MIEKDQGRNQSEELRSGGEVYHLPSPSLFPLPFLRRRIYEKQT